MTQTYDVESFRENFEHYFTWLNGFIRNTGRHGSKPALHDLCSGRRWNYSGLNTEANRLAHAFIGDSVPRHGVVMFMLLNSPEFVFSYIAAHKCGAIACPVNFRLPEGEIALLLEDSKPEVFIFGNEFASTARKALAMSSYKPRRIIVVGAGEARADGETDYAGYVSDMPEHNPELPFEPSIYDETTRLYTSGTTSRAKAVPLNNVNEVLSSHDVMMHFPLGPNDRTMNMTPWFHRGGLHSGGPTPTLYAGGEVVILREFSPRACLEAIEKYRVTFVVGVPSILALLARKQEHEPADLSSLRGIVTMGSPFDKAACEKYMELFTPNIFNGYGTTETFWNTFLRPHDLPAMAGSAGQACTDDDVRLVRVFEDGHLARPDEMVARDGHEIGEIIIRSPVKSAGSYVDNEELTARKFFNGYHYTGDLGTWDRDEFVTVVGRKDDMILSAGENIFPSQVEAVLNEHPKVAESAVVGEKDASHGMLVAAYVVPEDLSLTVEELRQYCNNHPMLPAFRRPRHYYLVKSLPHTATGKLVHYKLRKTEADGYFL